MDDDLVVFGGELLGMGDGWLKTRVQRQPWAMFGLVVEAMREHPKGPFPMTLRCPSLPNGLYSVQVETQTRMEDWWGQHENPAVAALKAAQEAIGSLSATPGSEEASTK